MDSRMTTSGGDGLSLQQFAADLRDLLATAGFPSIRALAKKANYSHTVLANAAKGRQLPSWDVTRAFVKACNGDVDEWEQRWRTLLLANRRQDVEPVIPSTPWPVQAVEDGADPEDAGCYVDARTVTARKISLMARKQIIGVVELRYCEREHAAWGRFKGSDGLDALAAHRYTVDTVVEVIRESDGRRESFTPEEYPFDYQWCTLVVADGGLFYASAQVLFDGEIVAFGETDKVSLT
jgi:hypothetical protein